MKRLQTTTIIEDVKDNALNSSDNERVDGGAQNKKEKEEEEKKVVQSYKNPWITCQNLLYGQIEWVQDNSKSN